MARHTDKRRGFTLVEAVIVLVVFSVLIVVGVRYLHQREEAERRAIEAGTPGDIVGTVTYLGAPTSGAFLWIKYPHSSSLGEYTNSGGGYALNRVKSGDALLQADIRPGRTLFVHTRIRPGQVVVEDVAFPLLASRIEFPNAFPHDEEVISATVWARYDPSRWELFEAKEGPVDSESKPRFQTRVPAGTIRTEVGIRGDGYSGKRFHDWRIAADETLAITPDLVKGTDLTFKVSGLPESDRATLVRLKLFELDWSPATHEEIIRPPSDAALGLVVDILAQFDSEEFTLAEVPAGNYTAIAIRQHPTGRRFSNLVRVSVRHGSSARVHLTIPPRQEF